MIIKNMYDGINEIYQLFHDRGRYHIETKSLICYANQWTGSI